MVSLQPIPKAIVPSNWIVQKFGGTSVGKFPIEIVQGIIKYYVESIDKSVAVVCSARSAGTKAEGTTSRLLHACDLAAAEQDFNDVLEDILQDHIANAEHYINDPVLQTKLVSETRHELRQVKRFLDASRVLGEVSTRTTDLVMSVGEKLSCLFITALCNDNGLQAKYFDLSHVIPQDIEISSLDNEFYAMVVNTLRNLLEPIVKHNAEIAKEEEKEKEKNKNPRIVPIITGFFGLIPMGLLNGVGRGYTDLCAALVSVALNADEMQVWKEVDGIFTADPRKVPQARLLSAVTPDEAAELTYYGSEVIHPFTMEQVIRARIPIRIKNVQNPRGNGTIIYPPNIAKKGEATPPHPPEMISDAYFQERTRRGATAITSKSDVVVLNIHSNKKVLSHGFLANVFTLLNKMKLVVDLISTSEVYVSMAIALTDPESHRALKQAIEELKVMGTVELVKKMCIISLIGTRMKQFVGIASTMFMTLAEQGINIEMISQGANEINISCVINESDSLRALRAIHAKLLDVTDDERYRAETAKALTPDPVLPSPSPEITEEVIDGQLNTEGSRSQ